MNKERIECPSLTLSKEERIKFLLEQLEDFINSPYLLNLVENFGAKVPEDLSFKEKVTWFNNFAENNWNYRAKNKETERWNVGEENLQNYNETLESIKGLGLYDQEAVLVEPDHILILGGAINSNFLRPALAKEILDNEKLMEKTVIALSTNRELSENEFGSDFPYAKGLKSEYESLTKGTQLAFELGPTEQIKAEVSKNPFLDMEIVKFKDGYRGNEIYSVSAPSSDPNRRANSRDTFDCYLNNFNPTDKNILLTTTNLYVPYQLLAFIDLAIENNFYVDCIGLNPGGQENLVLFLQELKAAINQINRLVTKYEDYIAG